jgi:hypothetical protein
MVTIQYNGSLCYDALIFYGFWDCSSILLVHLKLFIEIFGK